ncbi:MAG: hypothetical protein ACTSUE_09575 [Promethearchaeota archaeon]
MKGIESIEADTTLKRRDLENNEAIRIGKAQIGEIATIINPLIFATLETIYIRYGQAWFACTSTSVTPVVKPTKKKGVFIIVAERFIEKGSFDAFRSSIQWGEGGGIVIGKGGEGKEGKKRWLAIEEKLVDRFDKMFSMFFTRTGKRGEHFAIADDFNIYLQGMMTKRIQRLQKEQRKVLKEQETKFNTVIAQTFKLGSGAVEAKRAVGTLKRDWKAKLETITKTWEEKMAEVTTTLKEVRDTKIKVERVVGVKINVLHVELDGLKEDFRSRVVAVNEAFMRKRASLNEAFGNQTEEVKKLFRQQDIKQTRRSQTQSALWSNWKEEFVRRENSMQETNSDFAQALEKMRLRLGSIPEGKVKGGKKTFVGVKDIAPGSQEALLRMGDRQSGIELITKFVENDDLGMEDFLKSKDLEQKSKFQVLNGLEKAILQQNRVLIIGFVKARGTITYLTDGLARELSKKMGGVKEIDDEIKLAKLFTEKEKNSLKIAVFIERPWTGFASFNQSVFKKRLAETSTAKIVENGITNVYGEIEGWGAGTARNFPQQYYIRKTGRMKIRFPYNQNGYKKRGSVGKLYTGVVLERERYMEYLSQTIMTKMDAFFSYQESGGKKKKKKGETPPDFHRVVFIGKTGTGKTDAWKVFVDTFTKKYLWNTKDAIKVEGIHTHAIYAGKTSDKTRQSHVFSIKRRSAVKTEANIKYEFKQEGHYKDTTTVTEGGVVLVKAMRAKLPKRTGRENIDVRSNNETIVYSKLEDKKTIQMMLLDNRMEIVRFLNGHYSTRCHIIKVLILSLLVGGVIKRFTLSFYIWAGSETLNSPGTIVEKERGFLNIDDAAMKTFWGNPQKGGWAGMSKTFAGKKTTSDLMKKDMFFKDGKVRVTFVVLLWPTGDPVTPSYLSDTNQKLKNIGEYVEKVKTGDMIGSQVETFIEYLLS